MTESSDWTIGHTRTETFQGEIVVTDFPEPEQTAENHFGLLDIRPPLQDAENGRRGVAVA